MAERRLDCLTSLRFFACLLVVLFHCARGLTAGLPGVAAIVASGDLGVGFFFVLSGFVLAVVYAPRLADRTLDRRKFFVARFARIYPLYFATILVAATTWAEHLGRPNGVPASFFAKALVLRLTLLSGWVPGYAMVMNTPAWTLSVEAFFYAMFPLTIVSFRRIVPRNRAVWVAAALGASVLVPILLSRRDPSIDLYHPLNTALFFPPLHFGSFLVGVAFGLAYVERSFDSPAKRRILHVASALSLAFLAIGVILRSALFPLPLATLMALPFAILILDVAENDGRFAVLRLPTFVLLGEASYGIYILQEPVFMVVLRTEQWLGLPETTKSVFSLLAYLALLGVVSVLSLRLFETPVRRWIRAHFEPVGSLESRTVALGVANETSRES